MLVHGGFSRLLLTTGAVLFAAGEVRGAVHTYYDDSNRPGYYGYKDPEESAKKERAEPSRENRDNADRRPEARRVPKLSDYAAADLWNMHPDEFEALEREFMKKAVQSPTVENVEEHLYMKDLARRKALAYTNTYMVALQKNPELSLERDMPVSAGARTIMYRETEKERMGKLTASRDDFAIVYFSSASCPYCLEQDRILGYFTGRTKWTVRKVDREAHPDIAARFGITKTPALLLVRKGREDYFPITSGIISLAELEDRVYMGVRLLNNETTPENYTIREYQRDGGLDTTLPLRKRR